MGTGNDEMRVIVETGLKRHALVDQCICDDCVREYGPGGAPGRCGHCRDSEQGVVCPDRSAYLALRAMLDESDQVVPKHRKQEDCPWCAKQFCSSCDRVVRYSVNPNNPPTHCPKCRRENVLTLRGVRHQSLEKAADHRMMHRLETKEVMNPRFMFYRLPDGRWGVKGPGLREGDEVTIERRDGELSTVRVGQILDTDEFGMSIATIARTVYDA